jgi:flagellar export protein FliJ
MTDTFTFRPLLTLRKRDEDVSRQAFAAARAEVEAVEARLSQLRESLLTQNQVARQVIAGGKVPWLGQYRRCVEDILAAIDEQNALLKRANEVLARRREELVEAMKQRQAVSDLKEKFDRQLAAEDDRRQTKEQDDVHASHSAFGKEG